MEAADDSVNPVFRDLLDELQQAAEDIPKTQERMMSITGVAWSDDRLVKVVAGPRGQLVDLEIDPRVFRKPDAAELSAKILATSAAAISRVTEQVREIMDEAVPPGFAELRAEYQPEYDDPIPDLLRSDAEILSDREVGHG